MAGSYWIITQFFSFLIGVDTVVNQKLIATAVLGGYVFNLIAKMGYIPRGTPFDPSVYQKQHRYPRGSGCIHRFLCMQVPISTAINVEFIRGQLLTGRIMRPVCQKPESG